ncbi:MAG: GHKL domain-containing protein [Bacteroidales bacterium]|nr:GHKL domain-containing protein [Bacteroidales bacterium]
MDKIKGNLFSLTQDKHYRLLAILVALISMAGLLILQHKFYNDKYGDKHLDHFEKTIHSKQEKLNRHFDRIIKEFDNNDPMQILHNYTDAFEQLREQQGISVFYFEKGSLVYWSDHSVDLGVEWTESMNEKVYETLNATYVSISQPTEEGMLFGLILIRTEYPYQNEYLKNSYQKEFKLGPEVDIVLGKSPLLSPVHGIAGQYLFSLDLGSNLVKNRENVTISFLLLMISMLSVFAFFILQTDAVGDPRRRTYWFLASILFMMAVYFFVIYLEFPPVIFESDLFSPYVFASKYFMSLGHLLISVCLILMVTLLIYWFFNRSDRLPSKFQIPAAIAFVLAASVWFVIHHNLEESLVIDSTISFEAYKLNNLSIYTYVGVLILFMGILVFCLLIDKAIRLTFPLKSRKYYLLYISGILVVVPFLFFSFGHVDILTMAAYLLIISSLIFLRNNMKRKIRFSRFLPLLIIVSVYMTLDFQFHTFEKRSAQMDVYLAKLSSEQDAVAEMLFTDISDRLRQDSVMMSKLSYQYINDERILEYLQRNYFSGYWTKYDLRITICRPDDNVYIEPPVGKWFPCFPFFEKIIMDDGMSLEDSDFYFLNNLNGRISYLAEIPYITRRGDVSLFIELDSKIISEELGYPSLLLKEKPELKNPFSFAKYNQGKLINSGGDFNYRLTVDYYSEGDKTFERKQIGGYNHAIYNVDPENTVIVSVSVVSAGDKLISFSYTFALLFAVFSVIYLIASASHVKANVTWDFKNKIQYSVIGVLFLTFIFICSGTIYFVIQQYRIKHEDNLQAAMRSLYIELIHKVEYEDDLRNWSSESYYNLDELLRKFSNVFYTDINLYDENGFLLATSRAEIFNQKLLSDRMDRNAYQKLAEENYSAFIQTEKIGRMTYQSAYVPLLNSENNFLAYLNLPYFTQPEILTQEVTNLVVAILNIYVFLMLLILFLSVLIADRITQPLRFIQDRIKHLSLSKINEKIVYNGKDEIAGLVHEYNSMVDELEKSARLLAQSERESAWREMAKQIAHEIKNPLTPMKLNVQHMQRMLSEETENLHEKIEQVGQTLIEQIDSLTFIANEFSDFAKMPRARNREIDVLKKLRNAVSLFENTEGLEITLDAKDVDDTSTFGDPEQFQRVIINLIKNGIQSVPERRTKVISVTAEKSNDGTVIISISDNGKGISESIRDKLFRPNFTTKSSGMGMGLAIAANIISSMNGKIRYETEEGKGTTFFIEVPLV